MQVSGIKPAGSGSPTSHVAGLGREAMILNFCQMIDEWLQLAKSYKPGGSRTSSHPSPATLNAMTHIAANNPALSSYTRTPTGIQKNAAAGIAATFMTMA